MTHRVNGERNLLMQSVAEAEKKIEVLSSSVGVSPEGKLWMELCLDPFSDTPKRPVGFPDLITGKSVVQTVRQSFTYVNNTGADQDVHIFMDSLDSPVELQQQIQTLESAAYRTNQWNVQSGGTTYRRGGVRCRSGSVGANLTLPNTSNVFGADLPTRYFDSGYTRVISKGFEIHNTTPQLQLGGSVCVYRDASSQGCHPSGVGMYRVNTATNNTSTYALYPLPKVPENLAEAVLISDSRQWEAKDGVYCVATMNSQVNDPFKTQVGIAVTHDSSNTNTYYDYVSKVDTFTSSPSTTQSLYPSPFLVSGAYFTGLPDKTSLTVTAVWTVERFVDHTNPDLIVLATPSPYYDPQALELYARTAHRLPVGTKVGNNASGDWIKTIADCLGAFGVPGMPLVKGAVDLWNNFTKPTTVITKPTPSRLMSGNEGWTMPQEGQKRLPRPPQQRKQPVKKKEVVVEVKQTRRRKRANRKAPPPL